MEFTWLKVYISSNLFLFFKEKNSQIKLKEKFDSPFLMTIKHGHRIRNQRQKKYRKFIALNNDS